MATVAQQHSTIGTIDAWEMPAEKPMLLRWTRTWLQNPIGLLGMFLVVGFVVLGLIGPYIAPYDPRALDAQNRLQTPSSEHWLGTTALGQDMLSRTLDGARLSLWFGGMIFLVGFIPGTVLGIASGYMGRWIDNAIQRSAEAWTSFPQLPILLTVIAAVGPGLNAVLIVVALSAIFSGSRILRAVALVEKNKDYIMAARSTGASEWRLATKHIVPNIMPFILVGASQVFALAVLVEATLSFLGLGAEQGTPGWGIDLAKGRQDAALYPHLVLFPGLAISLVVLGFNLMGDTLRDILDPRLRGSTGPRR